MYEHINTRPSNFDDVGHFHFKFGLHSVSHAAPGPREVDPELLEFRIKFLIEELSEFCEGAGYKILGDEYGNLSLLRLDGVEADHAQMFDALLDLVYVAMGTAHLEGYPWQDGWARVQRANMRKERAKQDGSNSKRGSGFDVVKPKGWTPPNIEGLLKNYGFNNEEIKGEDLSSSHTD